MAMTKASEAIEEALNNFESLIHDLDATTFRNTQLEDVRQTARIIELEREQSRRMCNIGRIEPLLRSLGDLGRAVEYLCPCIPRVSYLWAPIKFFLQVADEKDEHFKQLLEACSRIAKHLPPLDELLLRNLPAELLGKIVADVCIDVLDFQGQIYLLLRRGGWDVIFNASWKTFSVHLACILQRLDSVQNILEHRLSPYLTHTAGNIYGSTSISGSATVHQGNVYHTNVTNHIPDDLWQTLQQDVAEARHFRQTLTDSLKNRQREQDERQFRESIAWLQLDGHEHIQERFFTKRTDAREEDTCEWILSQPDFVNWLDRDYHKSYLWLKGKPGSGKTTLATFLAVKAPFPPASFVLYCMCTDSLESSRIEACSLIFRSIIAQLLRKDRSLVSYVYEEFAKKAEVITVRTLLPLLTRLLRCIPTTYIIVDGFDECDQEAQHLFVKKLDSLLGGLKAEEGSAALAVRILICSRDTRSTPSRLRRVPTVSLDKESEHVSKDIKLYTQRNTTELSDRLSEDQIEEIVSEIVRKANGMFLWVKLVIGTLLDQQSVEDLYTTVRQLPAGLKGVYQTILRNIEQRSDDRTRDYVFRAFTWLSFSLRPLKTWELCDALVLSNPDKVLTQRTKLGKGILDHCKPLLEEQHDGTVTFIHFSVKEFLLSNASGPYIQSNVGYRLMTTTCVRTLSCCADFFHDHQQCDAYRNIVLGLHDLFPYVHKYWSQHLIQKSPTGGHPMSRETLVDSLRRASEITTGNDTDVAPAFTHNDSRNLMSIGLQVSITQPSGPSDNSARSATVVIDAIIAASAPAAQKINVEEQAASPIDLAYDRFRKCFESLLQNRSPYTLAELDVTQAEFAEFRDLHAHEAYVCTWEGCARASKGFTSYEEREKHIKVHSQPFCCSESTCEFANTPFSNRAGLKRHLTRYHSVAQASTVPRLRLSKRHTFSNANMQVASRFSVNGTVPKSPQSSKITNDTREQDLIKMTAFIRSDQVAKLPHVTASEKVDIEQKVTRFWEALNSASTKDHDRKTAFEGLRNLSNELMQALKRWNAERRAERDADGSVRSPEDDASYKFSQLPSAVQAIVNHAATSFCLPPSLTEGSASMQTWLLEAKLRYGQATHRTSMARRKKDELERAAEARELQKPLSSEEKNGLQAKLSACDRAIQDSANFLSKFEEQQDRFREEKSMSNEMRRFITLD